MPSDQTSIAEGTSYGEFVCARCASTLIQPMKWTRIGSGEWDIVVRCPECFCVTVVRCTDDQVHLFQNMLEAASRELAESADMLDRQVFKETCDRFARALRTDQICPMDF